MISRIFEDAFSSHMGSASMVCVCGRTHYDTYNMYDEAWEKQLEEFERRRDVQPDKYVPHDHAIGSLIIGSLIGEDIEVVYGCPCDSAVKYEQFIIKHEEQIADYLKKRAKEFIEKAERISSKE
jgi:hypothetical protein